MTGAFLPGLHVLPGFYRYPSRCAWTGQCLIVADTFVEGEFSEAGNMGFRRLADYTSGNNRLKQDKAMTAPVGQEQVSGKWRITFMMPAEYTLATLPEPLEAAVTLREVPGRLLAAIRYSGTWSQSRYQTREDRRREWIKDNQLKQIGPPIFARYNAPFMPWFLRRNEVLIPVER